MGDGLDGGEGVGPAVAEGVVVTGVAQVNGGVLDFLSDGIGDCFFL